ncbi:MAG: VacJ family lipoprotein [Candidatus Binatia bacterium]
MRSVYRYAWFLMTSALCWGALCAAAQAAAPANNHDPLERVNRGMFWLNDQIDGYILEPAATGWDKVASDRVKTSTSNFFQNLRFLIVAANNLLQGKLVQSASDVGRFAVNTTVGMLGLFDPASQWGLEQHNEDFGQTLGYWGVPPGPYLVLPFFGPSNPRDAVGLTVDSFSAPYAYFIAIEETVGGRTVDVINNRALVLREVRQLRQASFDYYVAVRNAYNQRRTALINDRHDLSEQEQENLYQMEDEQ